MAAEKLVDLQFLGWLVVSLLSRACGPGHLRMAGVFCYCGPCVARQRRRAATELRPQHTVTVDIMAG
jgi:hypothetical protein